MRLELEDREVDFIVNLLGQLPMAQTLQAQMTHLIPKIVQQAQPAGQLSLTFAARSEADKYEAKADVPHNNVGAQGPMIG